MFALFARMFVVVTSLPRMAIVGALIAMLMLVTPAVHAVFTSLDTTSLWLVLLILLTVAFVSWALSMRRTAYDMFALEKCCCDIHKCSYCPKHGQRTLND